MVDILLSDRARLAPAGTPQRGRWAASTIAVEAALDEVRNAPSILEALRTAPAVVRAAEAARHDSAPAVSVLRPLVAAVEDGTDSLTGIAAVHGLGRLPGAHVDAYLAALIEYGPPGLANHAIWAMQGRAPSPELMDILAATVGNGGLAGMHAQQALAQWSRMEPRLVLLALQKQLAGPRLGRARRYVTETIGLVPGEAARSSLTTLATDSHEEAAVRHAAIASFAERLGERLPAAIGVLARGSGTAAEAVRAVRADRKLARRGPRFAPISASGGMRVAQVHLGAILDPAVSRAGMGDTGGVATLLSRLGPALAGQPKISHVLTVGRAEGGRSTSRIRTVKGHQFEGVQFESGEGASFAGSWPSMVAATRGVQRAFLAGAMPDVVHLRMADPGSLATSTVARKLGIPIVFTLAPDPHGPISAAEGARELDRRTFATADARQHYWFRTSVVEHLTREAGEVVLFPRRDLRGQLHRLVGIDVAAGVPRFTVVSEGIDEAPIARARAILEVPDAAQEEPILWDLRNAVRSLPRNRHGLPIVVSVGRMHQLKGMARIVEAFARDHGLAARANLVIIGGNLDDPSTEESAELSRIKTLFDAFPGLADRVVLMGHRPNSEIGMVLVAAQAGHASVIAAGGAYVCGSSKEEFGIAIVEAMAAGLPVVAPRTGGPATYVQPDLTGVLVDTLDPCDIAKGIARALELATLPETSSRTRQVVGDRFTIERMAQTLTAVYRITVGARGLGLPVSTGRTS